MRPGTLLRNLRHASIIGEMHWIPIEVERGKKLHRRRTDPKLPPAHQFAPRGSFAIVQFGWPAAARRSPRAERHPGRRWRPSHNSAAGSGYGRDWRGRCCPRCSCGHAANTPATAAELPVTQARGNTSRRLRRRRRRCCCRRRRPAAAAEPVAAAGAAVGGGTRGNISAPGGGCGVAAPAAVAAAGTTTPVATATTVSGAAGADDAAPASAKAVGPCLRRGGCCGHAQAPTA